MLIQKRNAQVFVEYTITVRFVFSVNIVENESEEIDFVIEHVEFWYFCSFRFYKETKRTFGTVTLSFFFFISEKYAKLWRSEVNEIFKFIRVHDPIRSVSKVSRNLLSFFSTMLDICVESKKEKRKKIKKSLGFLSRLDVVR